MWLLLCIFSRTSRPVYLNPSKQTFRGPQYQKTRCFERIFLSQRPFLKNTFSRTPRICKRNLFRKSFFKTPNSIFKKKKKSNILKHNFTRTPGWSFKRFFPKDPNTKNERFWKNIFSSKTKKKRSLLFWIIFQVPHDLHTGFFS